MKKTIMIIIVMALVLMNMYAKVVSEADVRIAAENWLETKTGKDVAIKAFKIDVNDKEEPMLYYFDFDPSGYVIMSCDDNIVPVIGYSNEGSIVDSDNNNQKEYIETIKNQINFIKENEIINTLNLTKWENMIIDNIPISRSIHTITMESDWHQGSPFNDVCPEFSNVRSKVGCGGTAFAQIVNYHKKYNYNFSDNNDNYISNYTFTDENNISHSYSVNIDDNYISHNFPNFSSLNSSMINIVNAFNSGTNLSQDQKATLSFASGIIARSLYAPEQTGTNTMSALYGFLKIGYNAEYMNRYNYSDQVWHEKIRANIDNNLPIYYVGNRIYGYDDNNQPLYTGHVFIIKGYNNDGNDNFYQINWGWGTSYQNQWYTLSALGPTIDDITYNYEYFQEMVHDISPYKFIVSTNGNTFYGTYTLKLTNKQTNEINTYTSTNGKFAVIGVSSNTPYDVTLFTSNDNFEWYSIQNHFFTNETLHVTLNYNPDKIIVVPDDYTDANIAIARIQNNGIVRLKNNTYSLNGWFDKHITLRGYSNDVRVSQLTLNDPNINNTDIIQYIKFTGGLYNDVMGILSLNNGAAPTVNNCSFNDNTLYISGISSTNPDRNYMGLALKIFGSPTQSNIPIFTNCTFNNNFLSGGCGGAAVGLFGSATFNLCTFSNNRAENPVGSGSYGFVYGGAVIIDNNLSDDNISFTNCTFTNNQAQYNGRDISLLRSTDIPQITIDNCTFSVNNTLSLYMNPSILLYNQSINLYSYSDIVIKNNKFLNLKDQAIDYLERCGLTSLKLRNNVFYNIQNLSSNNAVKFRSTGSYDSTVFPNHPLKYAEVINNTFKSTSNYGFYDQGSHLNKFHNNAFDLCTNTYYISSSGCAQSYNLVNTNASTPMIDNALFEPIWSATYKSACIDAGHINLDGDNTTWHTDPDDQDDDGTRLDIGAIPAHPHGAFTHQLSSQSTTDRYNWICFPYIDKLYTNTTPYDVDQLGYLLNTYHDNQLLATNPRILEEFNWNYDLPGGITWMYPSFTGLPREADSRHGYKVKMVSSSDPKTLEVSGFLCGTYGNTNETMTVNAAPTGSTREIWVGYFKTQSEDPFYALSDILSDLVEIKTKRWSLSRLNSTDLWRSSTRTPLFNFGEAVSLKYAGTTTKNFTWHVQGGGIIETMVYSEPSVSNFSFTEQSDYTPIYVQLDAETKGNAKSNAELALFINDVCYGAEVIEGEIVQINAYINSLDLSNANVEFRYWEPGMKNENKKYASYAVYDHDDQAYQKRTLDFSENQRFYQVSLDTKVLNNATLPKKSDLKGNFPNPFNPSTLIKYNIAEQGSVSLKIYNTKGQLVRQLVNHSQEAGYHSVEWNGTDGNGNKMPSGVYFYRLDTANSSSTKKMMLIK